MKKWNLIPVLANPVEVGVEANDDGIGVVILSRGAIENTRDDCERSGVAVGGMLTRHERYDDES
jgi:hypothetical protein